MKLRAVRGFAVDLLLAAAAAALRWHPVYSFFQEHPAVVYWGVGIAHLVLAPILTMHAFGGGPREAELVLLQQGIVHKRVYDASFVAVLTLGFFVPFLCAKNIPTEQNLGFSVAVFFAPYVFVALLFVPGDLARRIQRRTRFLFSTRGGRLALGVLMTAYLVLMESTMFLCADSHEPASLAIALLGLVLSYLPTRLIVFYCVTQSESRAEVVSLFLGAGFLAAQLVLG